MAEPDVISAIILFSITAIVCFMAATPWKK